MNKELPETSPGQGCVVTGTRPLLLVYPPTCSCHDSVPPGEWGGQGIALASRGSCEGIVSTVQYLPLGDDRDDLQSVHLRRAFENSPTWQLLKMAGTLTAE